jgi:uncharacterized protein
MKQPKVVVTGFAERRVAPDAFVMTGRVSIRASDSSAAHADLAQRFTALDRAAMALGADDIRLQRSAVSSWGESGPLRRWHAERSLTITCTDPARAAEIAGTFGRVADVAVDGPYWQVERTNPAHAEVQAAAVRDARERAARYATALGGELGRLDELRDDDRYVPNAVAMSFAAKGREADDLGLETLDLSPQPQMITASVQARWYVVLPT